MNGYAAYDLNTKQTETGKETDAAVLEKSAQMLRNLQLNPDSGTWNEIIRHNQRVWTVIQAEMLNPDNTLPFDVKNNLLNLSVFIDKQSFGIMGKLPDDRDLEKLDALISINNNIALGLRGIQ